MSQSVKNRTNMHWCPKNNNRRMPVHNYNIVQQFGIIVFALILFSTNVFGKFVFHIYNFIFCFCKVYKFMFLEHKMWVYYFTVYVYIIE